MRKNHSIEDKAAQKPLVDIRVMSALPDLKKLSRGQAAGDVIKLNFE